MNRGVRLAAAAGAVALLVFVARWNAEPAPQSALLAPARPPLARAPIRPEHMPAPFGDRRIELPDPDAAPTSETAAFCDAENWGRLDWVVAQSDDGTFRVDEDAWNRALSASQAGLASWMSICHQNGGPVEIVGASTRALLATYDTRSGLRPQAPITR